MYYIVLNPVRAGMVGDPAGYSWLSCTQNALGQDQCLLFWLVPQTN